MDFAWAKSKFNFRISSSSIVDDSIGGDLCLLQKESSKHKKRINK